MTNLDEAVHITRLAAVLRGAPDSLLDNAPARFWAYAQAGALGPIPLDDFHRLDRAAVASERIRARIFADPTD
jgi:hypothetical protein